MSSMTISSISASSFTPTIGITSSTAQAPRRHIPSGWIESSRSRSASDRSHRTVSGSMADRPRHTVHESRVTEAQRRSLKTPVWNHPLCENPCFDAATICEACFCPCTLWQKTQYSLKAISQRQNPMDMSNFKGCAAPCWIYFGLLWTPAFWLPSMTQRSSVRQRYGIEGSRAQDVAAAIFCPPCTLVQNQREVFFREKNGILHRDRLSAPENAIHEQPHPHLDMVYAPISRGSGGAGTISSSHRPSLVDVQNARNDSRPGSSLNPLVDKRQRTASGHYSARSPEERAIIERRQPWRAKAQNTKTCPGESEQSVNNSITSPRLRHSGQNAIDRVKASEKSSGLPRLRTRKHNSSYGGDQLSSQHSLTEHFELDPIGSSDGNAHQHILIERQNIDPNSSRSTSYPIMDCLPDEAILVYYDPNEKPQQRFMSDCTRARHSSASARLETYVHHKRMFSGPVLCPLDSNVEDRKFGARRLSGRKIWHLESAELPGKGKSPIRDNYKTNLPLDETNSRSTNVEHTVQFPEEDDDMELSPQSTIRIRIDHTLDECVSEDDATQCTETSVNSLGGHHANNCVTPDLIKARTSSSGVAEHALDDCFGDLTMLSSSADDGIQQRHLPECAEIGNADSLHVPTHSQHVEEYDGELEEGRNEEHKSLCAISKHTLDCSASKGIDATRQCSKDSALGVADSTKTGQHGLEQCLVEVADSPEDSFAIHDAEQHLLETCVMEVMGSSQNTSFIQDAQQHELESCVTEAIQSLKGDKTANHAEQHKLENCATEVTEVEYPVDQHLLEACVVESNDGLQTQEQTSQHDIQDCPSGASVSPEVVTKSNDHKIVGCNAEPPQIQCTETNAPKSHLLFDPCTDSGGFGFPKRRAASQPTITLEHTLTDCVTDHGNVTSATTSPRDDLILSPRPSLTTISPRPFNPMEQPDESEDPEDFSQTRRASLALSLLQLDEVEDKKSWDEQVAEEIEEQDHERQLAETTSTTTPTVPTAKLTTASDSEVGLSRPTSPNGPYLKTQKKMLTDGTADREALLRILKDCGDRDAENQRDNAETRTAAGMDGAEDLRMGGSRAKQAGGRKSSNGERKGRSGGGKNGGIRWYV